MAVSKKKAKGEVVVEGEGKKRGWPKGKKRGPRKAKRTWSRKKKVAEFNVSPGGAKQVGVEVLKTDGSRLHAPLGSTWEWATVGGYTTYSLSTTTYMSVLRVKGPDGATVAEIPSQYVTQVAANIWTKPLWC